MKKKIAVTYSVKYVKEIELEVNEEICELLDKGETIEWDRYDNEYNFLSNQEECFMLPIPNVVLKNNNLNIELIEYIDGSFDIESFELANR